MAVQNLNQTDEAFEASIHSRKATPQEIAYRDGYVRGKAAEHATQQRRRALETQLRQVRTYRHPSQGISESIVLAFLIVFVASVVGGLLLFFNNRINPVPETVVPTLEPTVAAPEATPEPAQPNVIIIERPIEAVVPGPEGSLSPANGEATSPANANQAEQLPPAAPTLAPMQRSAPQAEQLPILQIEGIPAQP
jgi:hypothetical protein